MGQSVFSSCLRQRGQVRRVTLLAGLMLAALAMTSARAMETAPALLAKARLAVGGDAWQGVLTQHADFIYTYQNHDEAGSSDIDYASGRHARRIPSAISHFTSGAGEDGYWHMQLGQVTRLKQPGAAELHLGPQSYGDWFIHGKIRNAQLLGQRSHAGVAYEVVRVEPETGAPFDYWINQQTHRIERRQLVIKGKTIMVDYRDFRSVGGVTLPFEERLLDGDDESVMRASNIVLNRPAAQMDFSLPRPQSIEGFSRSRPAVALPFETCGNHVCVMVTLNGQGPFRFLLDTGARYVMSRRVFEQLKLPSEGAIVLTGTGEATERGLLTTVKDVSLAGLTQHKQAFSVSAELDHAPVDGTVGYDWILHCPTQIDYAARQITFFDPAGFVYRGAARATPLSFYGQTPQIDGVIDGLPGKFTIDTGSDLSLTLIKSFVDQFDLVRKYNAGGKPLASMGIGGRSKLLAARGSMLQLGEVHISDPGLELSDQTRGVFGSATVAGNLGNGILRQMTILLDYQNGAAYLAANRGTARE